MAMMRLEYSSTFRSDFLRVSLEDYRISSGLQDFEKSPFARQLGLFYTNIEEIKLLVNDDRMYRLVCLLIPTHIQTHIQTQSVV